MLGFLSDEEVRCEVSWKERRRDKGGRFGERCV